MKVGIVGLGYVGKSAIRSLAARDVTRFLLVDAPGDGNRAAIDELRAELPHARFVRASESLPSHAAASWVAGIDLCVLAIDSVVPEHCLAVNAACVAAGVPLLPGLVMGDVAQVGPLLAGRDGPCLQCIQLRVTTALGRPALAGPHPPNSKLAERVGENLAQLATGGADTPPEILAYVWSNGTRTQHQPLRSFDCPACGGRDPRPAFAEPGILDLDSDAGQDDARIVRLEPRIVDPIMGLVRWTTRYTPRASEPRVEHSVASVAHPAWAPGDPSLHAGGSDLDPARAHAAALGEALDRLATTNPARQHLRLAPHAEVAEQAIDPARFDHFHAETRRRPGFPFAALDANAPCSWVYAWSMAEKRPMLVPAARVFTPMAPATPADLVDVPNVTGCATGSSAASAALGGLLEVIERDTFMIAWATRAPATGVRIDRHTPWGVGEYVAAFEEAGIEVRCVTLRLEWGVPVVIAIARSRHAGDPAAVLAAAAAPDLTSAVRRALKELTANLAHVRHAMAVSPAPQSADPQHVQTQDHHALLYARSDMVHHLERWWSPAAHVAPSAPENVPTAGVLARISRAIIATGSDVLVVDLSLPGLRQHGLHTFKVLVPEAYTMNFDARWPHFGGRRMQEAPVRAGLLDKPVPFDQLNTVPHPFP